MTSQSADYPVRFEADYPESPSRVLALLGVLLFLKGLLLIPHIVILYVLSIVVTVVVYIGYWAVLITGRFPGGMFNFIVGVQQWSARTDSWMYGWSDKYPPFNLGVQDYAARFEADQPESSSRLLALLGVIFFIKWVLLIPHLIILVVLGTVALIVGYIGFWVVLITGRYPEGLFNLITGFQRWNYRNGAWMGGLTDRYPPFSLS